jgi:hypothetical protein
MYPAGNWVVDEGTETPASFTIDPAEAGLDAAAFKAYWQDIRGSR